MTKQVNDLSLPENDAAIADHVRQLAERLLVQQTPGFNGVCIMASVYNLINTLQEVNGGSINFRLSGFTGPHHEGKLSYRVRVEVIEWNEDDE